MTSGIVVWYGLPMNLSDALSPTDIDEARIDAAEATPTVREVLGWSRDRWELAKEEYEADRQSGCFDERPFWED